MEWFAPALFAATIEVPKCCETNLPSESRSYSLLIWTQQESVESVRRRECQHHLLRGDKHVFLLLACVCSRRRLWPGLRCSAPPLGLFSEHQNKASYRGQSASLIATLSRDLGPGNQPPNTVQPHGSRPISTIANATLPAATQSYL